MKKWICVTLLLLVPAASFAFSPMSDDELSLIRARMGPELGLYFEEVLGMEDLTADQAQALWDNMTEEERSQARDQILAKVQTMTDEEKAQFRLECMEDMRSLNPEDMKDLHEARFEEMQSMTAEERDEVMAFRMEFGQAMGLPGPGMGRGPGGPMGRFENMEAQALP